MNEEETFRLEPIETLDELIKCISAYNFLDEPFKGIMPTNRSNVQVIEDILQAFNRGDCIFGSVKDDKLEYFVVYTVHDAIGLLYLMYLDKEHLRFSGDVINFIKGTSRYSRVTRFYFNSSNFQHSFRRWAGKQGALVNSIQYVMEV